MGNVLVHGSTRCLVLKPGGDAVFHFYVGGMVGINRQYAKMWAYTGTWRKDNDWLVFLMFCFKSKHLYQERMICRLIAAFHGPSLVQIDLVNDDMSHVCNQLGVAKTATVEALKAMYSEISKKENEKLGKSARKGAADSDVIKRVSPLFKSLQYSANRHCQSRVTMTVAPAIVREKCTRTRFLHLTRCSSFQHPACNCLEVVQWTEIPDQTWSKSVSGKPFVFTDLTGTSHGVYLPRVPNEQRGTLLFSAVAVTHTSLCLRGQSVIARPHNIDQDNMDKMLAHPGKKVDKKQGIHPREELDTSVPLPPCGPYTSVNWNFSNRTEKPTQTNWW